jgi:hypothetical protein
MLFADAAVIQVDPATIVSAAGTLAVGLAGGLGAFAKLLFGYLERRDEIHRTDFRSMAEAAHRQGVETLGAMSELRHGFALLVERVDRLDRHHKPPE